MRWALQVKGRKGKVNVRATRTRGGKREAAKTTSKDRVQTAGIRHAVRIKKHLKVSILLVQGAGWILVEGHDHLRTLKRSAR
jgi:hypothetical protein